MLRLRSSNLVQALTTVCLCVFGLYLVQIAVLDNLADPNPNRAAFLQPRPEILKEDVEVAKGDDVTSGVIWITMGLCWSANTKYHGKEQFPYKHAAPLSSRLWMRLTGAKVILQIVYSEDEPPDDLIEYKEGLEADGVIVRLVPNGDLPCVLKSQLIRLLAFEMPFVGDNDVVVTADVDAFVMTADIVKPIVKLRHRFMWIYRYELTVANGYTFMMPFIGARAKTWRQIFEYDGSKDVDGVIGSGLKAMIARYSGYMNFNEDYTWDVDQHITSYAILKSEICSLPKKNPLWKELNLEPTKAHDSKTCWHGSGLYEDCNNKLWTRNTMIRYEGGGCKWWHFYPDEGEQELDQKYREILRDGANSGIFNSIVGSAKKMKENILG